MADKKLTELTAMTAPDGADIIHIVDDVAGTPTNKKITLSTLFDNIPTDVTATANVAVTGTLTITGDLIPSANVLLATGGITPANSTNTTVAAGTIWFDANYIYVTTATDTVKRVALSTFT